MSNFEENENLIFNVENNQREFDFFSVQTQRQWYRCYINSARHYLRLAWDSGVFCMFASALSTSLTAFLVKLLHGHIPVFEIVIFRSSLSFVCCAVISKTCDIKPFLGQKACVPYLIARGAFGAAGMTTYFSAIQLLPLANAVTLFFLNPVVTAVLAWPILREPLGYHGATGVVTSLAGLIFITQPPFIFNTGVRKGWGRDQILGTLLGISASFFAAGVFISIRFIGKREHPLVMSVYFHMIAFLTSLIPLGLGVPKPAVVPCAVDWVLLMFIAFTSLAGQMLLGRGAQLLSAAKASSINFTQVIYSYIFGISFLHEHLSVLGIFGSVLITGGVLLVSMKPKPKAVVSITEVSRDPAPDVATASGTHVILPGTVKPKPCDLGSCDSESFNNDDKLVLIQVMADGNMIIPKNEEREGLEPLDVLEKIEPLLNEEKMRWSNNN